ncbi:MAG: HAD hydrolase family protein [Acidobacteria bacterium]|nr:HAD hydrolase family protein [Acidobacteriota bacterium]MBI3424512.1 HAD hydrolase family protein [Acidobacteriota bacterium]
MPLPLTEIEARARHIRLLLLDCDGVLTDGSVIYSVTDGHAAETTKVFHIHDGQGLRLARQAGLKLGLISGRASRALETRARELAFDYLYQNVADKFSVYEQLRQAEQLTDEQIAYIGDDLPDLAPLLRAGLGIAVADAVPDVLQRAHYVTAKPGGRGAVREAVELILKAQNRWDAAVHGFLPT